jgi:hypothetical protein
MRLAVVWDDPETLEIDGPPAADQRVLVAVITRPRDWELVQAEHWYRIPIARAPQRIGAEYLAFYHTRDFGTLRWSIAYYAPIRRYRLLPRRAILPGEADHPRAADLYYRIEIGPLVALPRPIVSARLRRVTFIQTTLDRLLAASEINDLWPRETARDRLWRALAERGIPAERDYAIRADSLAYRADLAVFCAHCNLAIECVESQQPRVTEARVRYDTEERILAAHGWIRQCFMVAEVMADVQTCVEVICQLVLANGGRASPC